MSTEKFQKARENLIEKLGDLEIELSIASDASKKFTLKKEIEEVQISLKRVEQFIVQCGDDSLLNLSSTIASESLVKPGDIAADYDAVAVVDTAIETTATSLSEPEGSVHLVIAAFLQGTQKSQQFRLVSTLFYQDQKGQKQQMKLSTGQEFEDIKVSEFPDHLRTLTRCALEQLEDIAPDSEQPWYLNVEVFVPTEFLGEPLSKWCASSSTLMQDYPIVLGCSDRFHPTLKDARELRNKMKQGWQRLQQDIPDAENLPLARLRWLSSDQAGQQSLEASSGFRCYGGWLKAGQKYLKNWENLVRSGFRSRFGCVKGLPLASMPKRYSIKLHVIIGSTF